MADVDTCLLEANVSRKELEDVAPPEGVTKENAGEVLTAAKKAAIKKANRKKLDFEANSRAYAIVSRMIEKGVSPKHAVRALLVRDLRDRASNTSLDQLVNGYRGVFSQSLDKVAEKVNPTITGGVRNKDLFEGGVRVAINNETGDNALENEIGTALRQAFDKAHETVTRLGGEIGKIVNYFPQVHSAAKLRSVKQDEWIDFVWDRLDRNAMKDKNGNVLGDDDLRGLLGFVYDSITQNGTNRKRFKRAPKILPPHMMTNAGIRNSASRILHFENADAFLEYNAKFGTDDLWGQVETHLHGMALDASMLKVFGPNPEAGFKRWAKWASAQDPSFNITDLDAIWDNIVGFEFAANSKVAQILAAGRDITSSAYMGTAVFASISDTVTVGLTAAYNGVSPGKVMARALRTGKTDRQALSRATGIIDFANSALAMSPRFEDSWGSGTPRRLADANYRISGMTGLMNQLRQAFLLETLVEWGRHIDKSFDDLPTGMKRFLDIYGLNDEWDKIRAVPYEDFEGGKLLQLTEFEDSDLAAKVIGAINTERDMAVLHPDAQSRAALNWGKAPGTAAGEILRSGTQFLSYPASMILHTFSRYAFSSYISNPTRAGYFAAMGVFMTLTGGAAVQLKELVKGREPRELDGSFWAKAVITGGSAPLIADLVLAENQFSQSRTEALLGPLGGVAFDAGNALLGVGKALAGDSDGAELIGRNIEQITRTMPFSGLWQGQLLTDRLLRDTILGGLDPTYADRKMRQERNLQNRYDQGMWWGYEDPPFDL